MADNQTNENTEQSFSKDTKFFKSVIAGLSVEVGKTPKQHEEQQVVRFSPRKFFDKRTREHFTEGYLATDNADAIRKLADDVNVEEIKQSEYTTAIENSEPAAL